MTQDNGKTKEISGRRENSQCENESRGLVKYGNNGSVNGIDQVRVVTPNCPGQDSIRSSVQFREGTAGKILERLKLIESEYLSYVKGHQQRLEARLDESRQKEEGFKNAVQELEQEIYNLISMQEQGLTREKPKEDNCL